MTKRSATDAIRMIPVRSLGELIDRVTPEEPDAMTGRLRDYGVYRGGSNADARLLTGLDKLGGADRRIQSNTSKSISCGISLATRGLTCRSNAN